MDCGDCEISHNPDHTGNPFWQKPNCRHNIPHLALAWRETTSCSEKKKNSSELHSKKKQNADWQSYELRTSTTRGPNWVTSYRATATELRAPNFQTGSPDRDTNYKAQSRTWDGETSSIRNEYCNGLHLIEFNIVIVLLLLSLSNQLKKLCSSSLYERGDFI